MIDHGFLEVSGAVPPDFAVSKESRFLGATSMEVSMCPTVVRDHRSRNVEKLLRETVLVALSILACLGCEGPGAGGHGSEDALKHTDVVNSENEDRIISDTNWERLCQELAILFSDILDKTSQEYLECTDDSQCTTFSPNLECSEDDIYIGECSMAIAEAYLEEFRNALDAASGQLCDPKYTGCSSTPGCVPKVAICVDEKCILIDDPDPDNYY